MNTQLATRDDARQAIQLVTDGLTSEHSKRAYGKALSDFFTWQEQHGNPPLTKALVQEYRQSLTGSPASINLRMSAIRKLATEAADNGLMDQQIAYGVNRVHGVKSQGVRAGNWLTKNQAQKLLTAPQLTDENGTANLKGYRDRAILAVMIGGGLRRSEVAALTFDHIQQCDGRWVIVDIIGKGNRVRTVPVPSWVKLAVDEWANLAGLSRGLVFQSIHKGGYIKHESMTPQAIRDVVNCYGQEIGIKELAAHDLRRTFAKLAHKGGAGLDQIQLSLGHASIKTTEKYLGVSQNLTDAPCDHLGLTLE
jgi:site-specific recombinase XerD